MATTTAHPAHTRRHQRRGPIFVVLVAALLTTASAVMGPSPYLEGRDTNQRDSNRPTITATFRKESYRPGGRARLFVSSRASHATLQLFRAGLEKSRTLANDVMLGGPVTKRVSVGHLWPGQALHVRMGWGWTSGLYFAELRADGGRVGYAPFVLRPRVLGGHRVAVVMPTQTWQGYNHRDDDGDGVADTWYARGMTARLGRPFLNRGVPPHYKYYDAPFLRWLVRTGRGADYLADVDLDGVRTGRELARRYALIVFPGHHEYVTKHEYDVTLGFRNRGGNLMFLSANNFYWRIVKRGLLMQRVYIWRDKGKAEAGLAGAQYFMNDAGQHRGRWVVRTPIRWLFAGTGLEKGSHFGTGGIEADRVYPESPRGTRVVAEIPNLFGRGQTAQMTYYERHGAKVFSAGAFTLAGSVWWPEVGQIVANLWDHLAADRDTGTPWAGAARSARTSWSPPGTSAATAAPSPSAS